MAKRDAVDQQDSGGNKIVTMIIAIVIVLIWLAIFVLLVKFDVGGFGSSVLRPVLKDVPIINLILPEASEEELADEYDYEYDNLDDANARIKELELEIKSLKKGSNADAEYVAELEKENERLQEFEKEQEAFKARVKEFDKNVVYADEAPDIEEYKTYYEQIEPENAEEIYRQVVADVQANQRVVSLAKTYSSMDPATAADVLTLMTASDLELVCDILSEMKGEVSAEILNNMDTAVAAKVTKGMTVK